MTDDMKVTKDFFEPLIEYMAPQFKELRGAIDRVEKDIVDIKAELKVTNGRLDLLEERYDDLRDQMNLRFEQVDRRFDEVDKRFELVDKRFEQVDKRFEWLERNVTELRTYVWTSGMDTHSRQLFVKEQRAAYETPEKE
jgi:predicted RNase H-like nuclease (RuvC/YqgF family)